jgi:DNA-binding protein HU-beta
VAAKKASKKAAPKKVAPKKPAKKVVKKAAPNKVAKAPVKAPAKKAAPVAVAPKKAPPAPPKKPMLVTPKNSSSKQYTQSELYECIKGYCGFQTRSEAKAFYTGFQEMLQGALKGGVKVVLPGLGKLQVKKTKARMGRNPTTQQPIMIPAKKKVAFTPLKALKDAVL